VVLLLVAVESYYLTATLVQHDDLSNLWAATTLRWLLFGTIAGLLFGTAGAWSRGSNRWQRIVGLALLGAALLRRRESLPTAPETRIRHTGRTVCRRRRSKSRSGSC
jgi:hypothetical protein